MIYDLTVVFENGSEYEAKFQKDDLSALTREAAREWLHREFDALECEPRNPVGKLILLDVIMDVAKYSGEKRFTEDAAWAKQFARCTLVALGRDTVRIDVVNLTIG